MNQYSFDIKLLEEKIIFERESTFENFVSQFQTFCSKILCIKNGKYLYFYDRHEDIPKNLRFDYKKRRGEITEYYFKDNLDSSYCVFSREYAKYFSPKIDEIDPPGITENIFAIEKIKNETCIDKTSFSTVIIDNGEEFVFNHTNYPLEIISR